MSDRIDQYNEEYQQECEAAERKHEWAKGMALEALRHGTPALTAQYFEDATPTPQEWVELITLLRAATGKAETSSEHISIGPGRWQLVDAIRKHLAWLEDRLTQHFEENELAPWERL